MKQVIFIIALAFLLLFFTFMYQYMKVKPDSGQPVTQVQEPTVTSTPRIGKEVRVNTEHYTYSYFIVQNPLNITLLPNFSDKKDSQTLTQTSGCSTWINGGFYDTQNRPLGLFVADGETIGRQINSALFNGFLWITKAGQTGIGELPDDEFRIALQTGPMLLEGGIPLLLRIQNDQHARRMAAAVTKTGSLLFLTIYDADAVFDGPLLADLPEVLAALSDQDTLQISNAINLDGGSASAYSDRDIRLSELTPAGSLFCVRL